MILALVVAVPYLGWLLAYKKGHRREREQQSTITKLKIEVEEAKVEKEEATIVAKNAGVKGDELSNRLNVALGRSRASRSGTDS